MPTAINSALGALQSYGLKLGVNANNVANLNTEAFKKSRVLLSEEAPQGVRATIERVTTPGPLVYQSNEDGATMIEQSNVDLAEEIPDMLATSNAYKANLQSIETEQEMMHSLLRLKA